MYSGGTKPAEQEHRYLMTTHEKLEALARNLWWSWNPEVLEIYRRLDPDTFTRSKNNPVAVLKNVGQAEISDPSLLRDIDTAYAAFRDYLKTRGKYGDSCRVSYFCMEYGLHESLPIYSGGLGVLAGDHAKAASDLGLSFTAVGLFLREGYFAQRFTHDGWQLEDHPAMDPPLHPLELVKDNQGETLVVTVQLGDVTLHLQAWRIELGRNNIYLLDSDRPENPEELRQLAHRLYQGDRRTRLQQEVMLGIGGVRLLRALGVEADVYHMNEGHCAFLTLELLRERLAAGNVFEEAESWVRDHCVFTTHTPVLAGHDRFEPRLLLEQLSSISRDLNISDHDLLAYGRVHPQNPDESFTMTVLGLKLSRDANGVSRLNGEVAREQWHSLYPDRPLEDVPIDHITNGVHLSTWAVPTARVFLKEKLGNWTESAADESFWSKIDEIPDEVLWAYRNELRSQLVDFAQRYAREQTLPIACELQSNALTIGFARRFATYKRAPLIFSDLERVAWLFGNQDRPVQVLFAGKAHPADEGGKRFIQRIVEASHHPRLNGRVVFLENYDMSLARMLVSGCDVWLNNPRRPMEASGTSGQKVSIHGGLNLSILDGWWPEGHTGFNGWAINPRDQSEDLDPNEQDARDARSLYDTLEQSVVPSFYERDERGLPLLWIRRMKNAMKQLVPQFSADRMVTEYIEKMYDKVSASEMRQAAAGGR